MKNKILKCAFFILVLSVFSPLFAQSTFPEGSTRGNTEMNRNVTLPEVPNISVQITQPETGQEVAFSVRLLILLTVLTIAPSLLLLLTSFLRFSIVLDFIKRALSLQQVPPTAVLNGIALFMTIFAMWPTFFTMYERSLRPLSEGTIGLTEAYQEAERPLRNFMYSQMSSGVNENGVYLITNDNYRNIATFMNMAKMEPPSTPDDVPTYILIPSYILHELTAAFKIGVLLYIPFIIIDMVVASILMSMGMMMLPPVQISMPFKLILFVLVDGWGLLTNQLFISVLH